ncbi:MAG TPA: hypothetical protein VF082_01705 [Jiangellaceae bacterium]
MIYQHNTQGADRKIADALEALIADHEQPEPMERESNGGPADA